MSTLYQDLPLTNFPSDGVDTFPTYLNVTATDGPLIQQYMEAMNAGNQVLANQILAQIPAAEQKVIKATDLNKVMQATLAVERFYKDDIYDYIAQEQQNWENIINQFTYKGIYSSGNTYQKYNMVGYTTNGSTLVYIAIQDVPTGNAPLNETFWRVMTIQGQEGEPGAGLSYRLKWNPATQYEPNQAVTYDGVLWMALQTNINVQPGTEDNIWKKVLDFTVTTYPIQPTQPANLPVGGLWFNTEGNPTQYYYLTPLQSPASAGEIGTGYQAYDSEGNVIMGTATLDGPTYIAGNGIKITGGIISAKISTDANNKVEFGTDGGLFVDTGVNGAVQGNFVGFGADGQLIDSGLTMPLKNNLTLYVNSISGNDNNDGLSSTMAKKTVLNTLNTLPKDLGGKTITINLVGNFSEKVDILNYSNGYLNFLGEDSSHASFTNATSINNNTAKISFQYIDFSGSTSTHVITARDNNSLVINDSIMDASEGGNGPIFRRNFYVAVNDCEINNASTNAVLCCDGLTSIINLSGSNNGIGVLSGSTFYKETGIVVGSNITIQAISQFSTQQGGIIFNNGALYGG